MHIDKFVIFLLVLMGFSLTGILGMIIIMLRNDRENRRIVNGSPRGVKGIMENNKDLLLKKKD